MSKWTPEALAAEEARRAAIEAKGECPDSGLPLDLCKNSICDCFRWERPAVNVPRQWVLDFARPDDWVTLNGREHFHATAALTKVWRHAAKTYAQHARIPHLERAHIVVQPCFTSTSTRRRDVGNWAPSAKACVDGLVDAGVLDNDDDEHLTGPDMRRGPVVKGLARIRITITELPTERTTR